jgi:hypothetical protein
MAQNLTPDVPIHETPAGRAILTKGTEAVPAVLVKLDRVSMENASRYVAQPGQTVTVAVTPTQVRKPWRSTARTLFQALMGLVILFPILVQTAGLDPSSAPWLAVPLAVAAGLARIMALPQVNDFLARFVPWLSAAGR